MPRAAPIRAGSDPDGRLILAIADQVDGFDGDALGAWLRGLDRPVPTVVVRNGRLRGRLDLRGHSLRYGIELSGVEFDEAPTLSDLRCPRLRLADCSGPGLDLARAQVAAFRLDRCTVTGVIDLDSARIEHGFGIHDCTVGGGTRSVRCCWLRSGGSVGFARVTAVGMIDFLGAQINGELWLEDLTATGDAEPSLRADLASVAGSVTVQGRADGEMSLSHLTVNGDLDLRRCEVTGPDRAVTADSVRIAGRALLSRGFKATGRVLFIAAEVRDLDLRDAVVNHDDRAVELDRLRCRNNLDLTGAVIIGGVGMEGVAVGGSVLIVDATVVSAEPDELPALELANGEIGGNLLVDKSAVTGGVRAPGLDVKQASLTRSTIARPGAIALSLLHAQVRAQLKVRDLRVTGAITLAGATTVELSDEVAVWEHADYTDLDGFSYQRLTTDGWTVAARLDWLRRRPPPATEHSAFRPAPYDALAGAYRSQGEPGLATTTLIAKENDRLRSDRPHSAAAAVAWLGRQVLKATVAHGYRPARAIMLLAGLVTLLAALFVLGPAHGGAVCSVDAEVPRNAFNPFVYSLDTIIPIIDFGEAGSWRVDATAPWAWLYRSAVWLSIAAGWVLSTLLVAAVATLNRSEAGRT